MLPVSLSPLPGVWGEKFLTIGAVWWSSSRDLMVAPYAGAGFVSCVVLPCAYFRQSP